MEAALQFHRLHALQIWIDPEYEELQFEGYGPSGVAIIVEALTDNKNRTAADIRHLFDKYGGSLGTINCVSFMFEDKGQIIIMQNPELSYPTTSSQTNSQVLSTTRLCCIPT